MIGFHTVSLQTGLRGYLVPHVDGEWPHTNPSSHVRLLPREVTAYERSDFPEMNLAWLDAQAWMD